MPASSEPEKDGQRANGALRGSLSRGRCKAGHRRLRDAARDTDPAGRLLRRSTRPAHDRAAVAQSEVTNVQAECGFAVMTARPSDGAARGVVGRAPGANLRSSSATNSLRAAAPTSSRQGFRASFVSSTVSSGQLRSTAQHQLTHVAMIPLWVTTGDHSLFGESSPRGARGCFLAARLHRRLPRRGRYAPRSAPGVSRAWGLPRSRGAKRARGYARKPEPIA